MGLALEVRDLRFRYGDKPVLQVVSLRVEEGGFTSIVGPNGAGKSTLLRCLNRVLEPDGGSVTLFGKPLGTYAQREVGALVGYVPQSDGGPDLFTVREYVELGRYPHLSPFTNLSATDREAVDQALAEAELDQLADRPMAQLSGGEHQRVLIAAALAQGARLLLLDEPTTFMDYRHQLDLRRLLKRLNQGGRTILAVTHDLHHALWWSDQVLALAGGVVAYSGEPSGLVEPGLLESIFGAPFQRIPVAGEALPLAVPARLA